VTITECDFNLASDLAVLAGDDQLDPPEMILRQAVIENLKHAIDAAIEFPFIRFRIVGTAHTIWKKWKRRVLLTLLRQRRIRLWRRLPACVRQRRTSAGSLRVKNNLKIVGGF